MDEGKEDVEHVVKEFLASNGDATSQRSSVNFRQLDVEGSGAGVRISMTVIL